MTRITRAICIIGALLSVTAVATTAYSDGRDYNDGTVKNITFIRTVDGHFDDYMHWLATTYKKQQEAAKAAGLITRYKEPWRLGVDRFMAVIASYHMARARGACVVDLGTAMTVDLVDPLGVHLGGAIIPGPELMVGSVLRNTAGIARRASGAMMTKGLFALDTRAAINQGARYAAAAVIDRAVGEAQRVLQRTPLVLLTGGAAVQVESLLQCSYVSVPDLVLRGVALRSGLALK